eukprot:2687927-Pyramimonas_sp.AAC.1
MHAPNISTLNAPPNVELELSWVIPQNFRSFLVERVVRVRILHTGQSIFSDAQQEGYDYTQTGFMYMTQLK